jgi:hypothetical protein
MVSKPLVRYLLLTPDTAASTPKAALEHARGGTLVDVETGEELGRKEIEIQFAVGVLGVRAAARRD